MKQKTNYIIGGLQAHQYWRTDGISPCINAAAGMGGGHTALVLEVWDEDNKNRIHRQRQRRL